MARGAMGRAPVETPAEDGDTALVDKDHEVDELRTGPVGEDDFLISLARKAKWVPKEEWKRDPAKWTDHRTYLERLPAELETLQERNRRTAQAAADAIEEDRRRTREAAQAEVRAAAEDKDPERATRAAEQLARASGPAPQTIAWMARNAWFNDDPDAQIMAVAEINRVAQSGASIEDQLAAGEAKVKRRFPEYFGQAEEREEPKKEVRLSERTPPPALQGGTRGAGSHTKEKGFNDIAAGDRALFDKHFRRKYETYLKPEEAQAKYAKAYWANKG